MEARLSSTPPWTGSLQRREPAFGAGRREAPGAGRREALGAGLPTPPKQRPKVSSKNHTAQTEATINEN